MNDELSMQKWWEHSEVCLGNLLHVRMDYVVRSDCLVNRAAFVNVDNENKVKKGCLVYLPLPSSAQYTPSLKLSTPILLITHSEILQLTANRLL